LLAREYARARIQVLAGTCFSIRSGQGFLISDHFAETMNTVVGITGASGIVYGVRLLEELPPTKTVIVSDDAQKIARLELGISGKDIRELADFHYANDDMYSPLASGSVRFDSFVIAPCSTSTMSKIAAGISDNLITRIASVALKERRKLVLLLRETPLSTIHLSNMERLSQAGAIIMPASPAFYPRPRSVDEMVDFVVGRVLDELGVDNDLYARWKGVTPSTRSRGSRRTRR
jgi:4-hydroxy-3-polyprenylbenzoate decarboxylase